MEGRAIARPNPRWTRQQHARHAAPSMEGRAIARPNPTIASTAPVTMSFLQWRAGQLPGQTRGGGAPVERRRATFNGGPGNCPAKPSRPPSAASAGPAFNGGPGNCPAKPPATHPPPSWNGFLQWRAGQLPGQTDTMDVTIDTTIAPSMEGRAIARPNVKLDFGHGALLSPSMEGRAIARPNCSPQSARNPSRRSFNGGPGNCPAKRATARPYRWWCAGTFNGGPGNCPAKRGPWWAMGALSSPSMEGRAIARPNSNTSTPTNTSPTSLQWRAGQLPGQTSNRTAASVPSGMRRPSMEGRAIARPNQSPKRVPPRSRCWSTFNGGPGNCPAKPLARRCRQWEGMPRPSMEGRAIARPNGIL